MSKLGEMARLTQRGWRVALVVGAVVVGTFPWNSAPYGLAGVVPILIWCLLAGSARDGVVTGLILLTLLAYFVVPRGLGFSGPLVPSAIEVCWLYPMVAAVVCLIAMPRERGLTASSLGLVAMVGAGLLITAVVLFDQLEDMPGGESVLPGPSELRTAEMDGHCGSGNCAREVVLIGDRAPELVREHLESRGFTAHTPQRMCRTTGLVFTHEVCAESTTVTPDRVAVVWYVN
ncbi:hypothetical protein PV646_19275 [Streptomyces sp. ID05-26A]|nr:hypothetical protein [Streptomyces sp. ID05-26A]